MTKIDPYFPQKVIDIRDYGFSATASSATNSTAFSLAAADAGVIAGSVFLPEGDFPVDNITIPRVAASSQVSFFSNPGRGARLIKHTADGNGLMQLSTSAPSGYMSRLRFSNLTFQGYAGDSPYVLKGYDLARCLFDFCQFLNGNVGVYLLGGIGNSLFKCNIDGNTTGLKVDKYTGGYDGYPNINTLDQCQITNSPSWGVDFDNGKMLTLRNCDIEGNGTSGDATTGGIRVGANIGSADPGSAAHGVVLDTCWIENNAGNAAMQFASGMNVVHNPYPAANANATYDMYVSGGTYILRNALFINNKTNNLCETVGVGTGNLIEMCTFVGGITIDAAKTYRIGTTGLDNFPRLRTGKIQINNGGTTLDVYESTGANRIASFFTTGTPTAWLQQVSGVGFARTGVDGSGADVDYYLTAKGAGKIGFGVYTALGGETLTGYITIKDQGGTLRKIAVIS
jgi:hypothetical protein